MTRRPALAVVVGALALSLALPAVPAPARSVAARSHPALFARLTVSPSTVEPGEAVHVEGLVSRIEAATGRPLEGVPATFRLRVADPTGAARATLGPFTAAPDGRFGVELPAFVTEGVTAGPDSDYVATLSVRVVDAALGPLVAASAGAAGLSVSVPPTTLELHNSFVSSVGWVKPNETYPFRVIVRNHTRSSRTRASVVIRPVKGMRFLRVTPGASSGRARIEGGVVRWSAGTVPPRSNAAPGTRSLVILAKAHGLKTDPRVVWRDLSTTAVLRYRNGPKAGIADRSHGPKVVPPGGAYETARYGDRPFPVVAAEYFDRAHEASHTAEGLAAIINSEDITGSTFNLYQEMSYGQLYPHATIPSAAIGTAGWDVAWKSPRYAGGFQFTELAPAGTCHGVTLSALANTPLYANRIVDGWYRLPGTTDYYGDDRFGFAAVGQLAGNALLSDIDGACGPTAKSVFDAAHIADPEIDYSDFDTDKDGVVDFFMLVFPGLGGNGDSQVNGVPPYDNIWPHSSSLEFSYTDPSTGLKGYVSDDQLKDLEGKPLFYTDDSYSVMTRKKTAFPVYVRVGPYNVNPESSVEKASVISHEYGHSLGLPDFYSNGRSDYGDFNLMATDKSQNMDIFGKQEMGWLIPRPLRKGTYTIQDWRDSKVNTNRIDWRTPDGTPYRLKGPNVRNGTAFAVKLPSRRLLAQEKIAQGASGRHVWWSTSGNDFGCTPGKGRNLDVYLPELGDLPTGTTVTLTFNHFWDIEWDFDYGFVMMTSDDGRSYESLPSENGYTTAASFNPQSNSCHGEFGNGITGTSGSYEAGTEMLDRVNGAYPDGPFLPDAYDLTPFAGSPATLRFSYSSDTGLAHPGWFIDDVKVVAELPDDGGTRTLYSSNFERGGDEPRLFNGGCRGTLTTATTCTKPWLYVRGGGDSPFDHGYYLEMRDRSGFDMNGHNQNDRDPIAFEPGLLLVYTDETHGYGNNGTDDPPAQSPVDAAPQPGNNSPNLSDATFNAGESFSDFGEGFVNSYGSDTSEDGNWHFAYNCLKFRVVRMAGGGVGPDVTQGDLIGDVRFTVGGGCANWDYGFRHSLTAGSGRAAGLAVAPHHRP